MITAGSMITAVDTAKIKTSGWDSKENEKLQPQKLVLGPSKLKENVWSMKYEFEAFFSDLFQTGKKMKNVFRNWYRISNHTLYTNEYSHLLVTTGD